MSCAVHLDAESVEAVAARVVELLADRNTVEAEPLIDAAEAARRLGVDRGTVYRRADQLGAIRIGDGPNARLRFDPAVIAERFASAEVPTPASPKPHRGRRPPRHGVELLPITGLRKDAV